jgi:hypothetical protein
MGGCANTLGTSTLTIFSRPNHPRAASYYRPKERESFKPLRQRMEGYNAEQVA